MADIQYLNYGDQQIEQQALLNSLANEVQGYVQNQPWSRKRKEKFMSAYSDLMNRGIRGASNSTGQWMINVGGDIPFDSMDRKDKEMYEEAAYFIQQQMAGLPTKAAVEEEEKKDLQLFDNNYFNKSFSEHLRNGIAGGAPLQIGGENDMWNYLDKRNKTTGLRDRTERAKKLAEYLKSYSDSLEEGKYNFEGTAFTDLNDFKSKIGKAIDALNTPDLDDDYPALNAIGLKNPQQYFNNGSGDPFKTDGYEGTYGEYYNEYLPGQQKKKAEEEAQKKKQAAQEFENNRLYFQTHSSKLFGKDLNYLAEKYQTKQNLVPVLQGYINKGLANLNGEELSELVGGFKYGARDTITDEELKAFRAYSPVFKNATKNQFRKFRGVEGAFFHVPTGKVYTYGGRDSLSTLTQQNTGDILKGRSMADKQQAYLQNTEFTDADWAELTGIGLDIASIIDPEPWSAGGLGLTAAGARNYARAQQPESWGLGDYLWQGVDYLTGAAGAIPGLGDAALAYKAVKSVAKIGRKILMIPALYDLASHTPGTVEAIKKAIDGKDLTVQDWKNIGSFVRGLTGTHNLTVQNRAARRALQKRGIETTNKWHQKLGLTETKSLSETTTPTIRVKVNDKVEEIPIAPERRTELEGKLKGKTEAERAEILKESKEVKDFIKNKKVKPEDVSIVQDKSKLNTASEFKIFGKRPLSRVGGRGVFGEKPVSTTRGTDIFNDYVGPAPTTWTDRFRITGNRGFLDRLWYGSNTTLRGMDRFNNVKPIENTQNNAQPERPVTSGTNTNSSDNKLSLGEIKKYFDGTAKHSGNYLSEEPFKAGDFNFEVNKLPNSSSGNIDISFNGKTEIIKFENQKDMMKKVAKFLQDHRRLTDSSGSTTKKINAEEMGKILRQLKAKGVFKQGGRIDKQKIQKYKEFINK